MFVLCWVASVMSSSLRPHGLQPLAASVHRILHTRMWSGLPCPPPGDLPDPGTKLAFLVSPALAGVFFTTAAAKSLQSCPTLCDPIDGSPPCSPVPGILQAKTLEWVAISFSNTWKWKVKVKSLSHVQLLATPWTAAHQAPLSMGFSRQEVWDFSKGPEKDHRNVFPWLVFARFTKVR